VGGLGTIFLLIGVLLTLIPKLRSRRDEALKATGTPVSARFQRVQVNDTMEVNGRNPFVVLAQWVNPETHEIHVFQSNNLWFDPTGHITADHPITVYIDRNNPKKYYVDLSFLPKLAP
jgi:predicted RNA-binding protein associated with RNAse of E/G family